MNNEKDKITTSEREVPVSDEQNVARLLSSLKRVDAPKDFDFRLRARIERGSPAAMRRPFFGMPVLKYALPLALFLAFGAVFIVSESYIGRDVPQVASVLDASERPLAPVAEQMANESFDGHSTASRPAETIAVENGPILVSKSDKVRPSSPRPPRVAPSADRDLSGAGSYDSAGNRAPDPIIAPVLKSGNSMSGTVEIGTAIPLQFRQMLMSIGIDASDAGEKTWRVIKLAKDGIAERSGLRVGDVMETIDDKPIDPLYKGSFTLRSISVRRDGAIVNIDLTAGKP